VLNLIRFVDSKKNISINSTDARTGVHLPALPQTVDLTYLQLIYRNIMHSHILKHQKRTRGHKM